MKDRPVTEGKSFLEQHKHKSLFRFTSSNTGSLDMIRDAQSHGRTGCNDRPHYTLTVQQRQNSPTERPRTILLPTNILNAVMVVVFLQLWILSFLLQASN